jgi:hypothetical protein
MYVTLRSVPKPTDEAGGASVLHRRSIPAAVLAFGTVSLLTNVSSEGVAAVLPLYITAVLGMGPLAYGFIDVDRHNISPAARSWPTRRRLSVAAIACVNTVSSRGGVAAMPFGRPPMTPPLGFGEEVMDGERRSRPKHRVFDFDHGRSGRVFSTRARLPPRIASSIATAWVTPHCFGSRIK